MGNGIWGMEYGVCEMEYGWSGMVEEWSDGMMKIPLNSITPILQHSIIPNGNPV